MTIKEKWREDKLKDMEKMQIDYTLKIFLREMFEDIFEELDKKRELEND